ncbi:bifunctional DNA primase/polymerase [Streptomyces sp. NPDC097619]|uniref:bifunctional DNA primase/polymerase n=1 Tax=Streptomyces sp. NPDC097619 TaxID=3157228 RepID=UPI003321C5D2
MSSWVRDETREERDTDGHRAPLGAFGHGPGGLLAAPVDPGHGHAARVTPSGAAWLASASPYPRSTLSLWESRPTAPAVLPCGSAFDVVNVPAVFGRRMLDRLWEEGPGSGPVAVHRGRMLLFAAPGTAHRLPALLHWEEWGGAIPSLLCHGRGDAVAVPALRPAGGAEGPAPSRWLVAPDGGQPWLPGPEVMLWACVRAVRAVSAAAVRVSIFPSADQSANVFHVSKRR